MKNGSIKPRYLQHCLMVGAVLVLMVSTSKTLAEPARTDAPDLGAGRNWEFVFAPYALAPTITGSSTIGRLPATDLNVGTDKILENLNFGAMVHAEALYSQKFGVIVDIAYMNVGAATDTPLTGGRVRSKISQLIVEGLASYRFLDTGPTSVEAFAGGRYWDIDIGFNGTGTAVGNFNLDRGDDWFDPVIGVRAIHAFDEHWSVRGRGDIGGFGIGADFTWSAQAGVGYAFDETWSLHLQYRAISVDFDNGKSGTGKFAYDTITHGPQFGLAVKF